MILLSKTQRSRVLAMGVALRTRVAKAGLTIVTRRLSHGSRAEYHRDARLIAVNRERTRDPRHPLPASLDWLFSVAHELGHHQSHEGHDEVGRKLDYSHAPEALFEEMRAWRNAGSTLRELGMREPSMWSAFEVVVGQAVMVNAFDFESYWWLVERMRRLKIVCPSCGSRALSVSGGELSFACRILCRRCGAHTRYRRSMRALSEAFRGRRFGGMCRCRSWLRSAKKRESGR